MEKKAWGGNLLLFALCRFFLKHYSYKFGFDISYRADIGPGFSITHFGHIIIRTASKIGKNCWVCPGLIIGKKGFQDDTGMATIGDNVEIGVDVIILGNVTIGNNVTIGANSVIVKDVPDNCVVAGVPGKIICKKEDY